MPDRKVAPGHRSTNPRHLRFAEEYVVDLNATNAAKRAGYSAKTAYSQGQRLLKNADVQAAVAALKAERRETTGDLATRVLRELELIAFADLGDVLTVDDQGKVLVRELTSLPPEVRRTISEITQVTTERTVNRRRVRYGEEGSGDDGGNYRETEVEKVKLGVKQHNKLTALQLLVDHLGLSAPKKHDVMLSDPTKKRLAARLEQLAAARKCAPG